STTGAIRSSRASPCRRSTPRSRVARSPPARPSPSRWRPAVSAGADVRTPREAPAARPPVRAAAVERNALITHAAAVGLTILLLREGLPLLNMRGLLHAHMFIGRVLTPPVALKLASTGSRSARYYTGAAAYREKGPPRLPLRVLAPVLVATTAMIFVSGVW